MVSGFVTQKLNTGQSLGEWLRHKREEMGVELEEVAHDIKVPKSFLQGLEEGNNSKLPADVYVQGFVKNYAEYLRLDSRRALKLLKKESGIKKNIEKEKKPFKIAKPMKFSFAVLNPRFIKIGLIGAIVVTAIIYLGVAISSFTSAPIIELESPGDKIETSDFQTVFKGKISDSDSEIYINGQKVFVEKDGAFAKTIDLADGINSFEIIAKNKFEKETKIERTIFKSGSSSNLVEKKSSKEKNDQIELEVSVREAAWISLEADGKNVFSDILMPDDKKVIGANENIKISSGKPSVTYLTFNGKDVGRLGDSDSEIMDKEFDASKPVASR